MSLAARQVTACSASRARAFSAAIARAARGNAAAAWTRPRCWASVIDPAEKKINPRSPGRRASSSTMTTRAGADDDAAASSSSSWTGGDTASLATWLKTHGVDADRYGKNNAKGLADLKLEVDLGESTLEVGPGGVPRRNVRVLRLLIRDDAGRTLVEATQRWNDPNTGEVIAERMRGSPLRRVHYLSRRFPRYRVRAVHADPRGLSLPGGVAFLSAHPSLTIPTHRPRCLSTLSTPSDAFETHHPDSEKLIGAEDWRAAAPRAVAEELGSALAPGYTLAVDEASLVRADVDRVSLSYPDLSSRYAMFSVAARIENGLPEARSIMYHTGPRTTASAL